MYNCVTAKLLHCEIASSQKTVQSSFHGKTNQIHFYEFMKLF